MHICPALMHSVRLELNHIYTEKPRETSTGWDMGVFCREHALHVAALAEMLGDTAQICCGDVIIRIPGKINILTLGTGADHAWCRVDELAPVDASLTLRYLAPEQVDVKVVCPDYPEGLSGFRLHYGVKESDDSFEKLLQSADRVLGYNEKSAVQANILHLLANPFEFLHSPPQGAPSLVELHGQDIFFAITAHLYKLSQGQVKPLRTYLSARNAIRRMLKYNPDARQFVEGKVGSNAI